jgi:hypothetical protein
MPMADIIKTGSILIAEKALLPAALLFKSEPYAPGWRLVKNLDSDQVNQIISQAGWSFLYMAGVIKTRIFGSDEAKTTRQAIKQIVAKMRSKNFNCLEITQVAVKRFLGLRYVNVFARSRHIQESPVLFGD